MDDFRLQVETLRYLAEEGLPITGLRLDKTRNVLEVYVKGEWKPKRDDLQEWNILVEAVRRHHEWPNFDVACVDKSPVKLPNKIGEYQVEIISS